MCVLPHADLRTWEWRPNEQQLRHAEFGEHDSGHDGRCDTGSAATIPFEMCSGPCVPQVERQRLWPLG